MSEQFRQRLIEESTGSTVLGIKGSRLHKIKIIVPKIAEQLMITMNFKAVEKLLKDEETILSKMSLLKLGLMQDLLTGRKRVKINTTSPTPPCQGGDPKSSPYQGEGRRGL